jgi:hypothetical protein
MDSTFPMIFVSQAIATASNLAPYFASSSRIRNRGPLPYGVASPSRRATHASLGDLVTLKCTTRAFSQTFRRRFVRYTAKIARWMAKVASTGHLLPENSARTLVMYNHADDVMEGE